MVGQLKDLLSRPFPEHDDYKSFIRTIACVSVFVFLFLYILQPFELDRAGRLALPYSLAFGGITFIVSIGYRLGLKKILPIDRTGRRHTFAYWLVDVMILILLIATANFVFMLWMTGISFHGWSTMLFSTIVVSVFPLVFIGAISMVRAERINQSVADQLNTALPPVIMKEEQPQEVAGVLVTDILYVESLQNYVRIHHTTANSVEVATIRATLSSLADQMEDSALARCHRSYIVNRQMILSATGNAQGLQLMLRHTSDIVPVSRRYVDAFRS